MPLTLYQNFEFRKSNYLQPNLLKLDNRVRIIQGVVNGDIIVNNRRCAYVLLELKNKGFTPFPKKEKLVEAIVASALSEGEESTKDNITTTKFVHARDYEYLLSMAIGTLALGKV